MTQGAAPRRVLMTADAVGGVWTYAIELAAGLAGHGVEVLLAVQGPAPTSDRRAEAEALGNVRLVHLEQPLEWQDRRGLAVSGAQAALLDLAAGFGADLVHINGYREAAFGFTAPVVLVAHSCVRSWWWACRGSEPPAEWAAYRRGVEAGLASADAVVAPSAPYLAELRRLYAPLPEARVIANGCEARPIADRRRPFILAAGRLRDEGKNVALLVRAAAGLPWPVLLAGDALDGGEHANVRHLGRIPREQLRALMAEAEIVCAPARYEPFGYVALEAASAGAALALGNIPSARELWGEVARLVPPDDPEALAGTLHDLIGDATLRLTLQRAARARARHFTRERMTRAYLDLYGELIARGTKERAA
jgi:glycogen synthase